MTQARSIMRLVLRSRAVRLVAGFCVVCALAFALGQSVAAFRASLAQRAATPLAPQTLERLSGAQGTTPTPPPAQPSHQSAAPAPDSFSSGAHDAAPVAHFEAQPGKDTTKEKDKAHSNHGHDGKAAGDSSHGGLSHDNGNGPGSDNGNGNGNGNGSNAGGQGAGNENGHGAGHQSGQDVGSYTGHGD